MPKASLSISPRPELVRIARLTAVSLARRSGIPDDMLDEVRTAVGEATSRAVRVHIGRGSDDPVRLSFTEDGRGYEVAVRDEGDADAVPDVDADLPDLEADLQDSPGHEVEALPAGIDLAVVSGFVDDLEVVSDPAGGTLVRLRWNR